jgi:hypothetical protein
MIGIYPQGREALSGPIYQAILPVSSGAITGAAISIAGAATVQEALYQSADNKSIFVDGSAPGVQQRLRMQFNVAPYIQLHNKRILNVSFIYSGSAIAFDANGREMPYVNDNVVQPLTVARMVNGPSQMADYYANGFFANTGSLDLNTNVFPPGNVVSPLDYKVLNWGDANIFWNPAVVFATGTTTPDIMPWRYVDLLRLDGSTAAGTTLGTAMLFQIAFQGITPSGASSLSVRLNYAALRVLYCEETRVAYGGYRGIWRLGTNIAIIRNTSFATDPTLPAGGYTVTASMVNPGDIDFTSALGPDTPKFNAVREQYALPSQPGVDVNIPFPPEDQLGKTFEAVETHVLPQLSLHGTNGAPLTEPHVYGRQVAAQVYGTVVADQDLADYTSNSVNSYPWVRFIARRFGNTTVPLTLTGVSTGGSVSITPDEFDALDEILDGWKQVTLRFGSPPSLGVNESTWRWSAAGELAGNRWEVVGASAPAVSGIPGNLLNFPAALALFTPTYQPPDGSAAELSWLPSGVGQPPVSGSAGVDDSSDAFLIFAQDVPAPTDFQVDTLCQELTGIGQNCDVDPCCVPTSILFNRLSWTALGIYDTYTREVLNGWGNANSCQPWSVTGGVVADYSVDGSSGLIRHTAVNTDHFATIGPSVDDVDIRADVSPPVIATGGTIEINLNARIQNSLNMYELTVDFNLTGTVDLDLGEFVAGVYSGISVLNVLPSYTANSIVHVRFQVSGTTLNGKVWQGDIEPLAWQITSTAVSFPMGKVGVHTRLTSANTNSLPLTVKYDNFSATTLINDSFGSVEIQRIDAISNVDEWETIFKGTGAGSFGSCFFNDFEARIGVETFYRIRSIDVYDFPGPWSDTISALIFAPGIEIGCHGGHLLTFTSNENQCGDRNLAYSSVWMDQHVSEDFTFPEAGFVQLQLMYNKDFYTAFRPLERGGERFARTLLVQAAAIPTENLADFTSLRDMAWDNVNYVCVRDEDGNRWFATVLVPSGRVLRDRRLYLAPVEIVEVTDTPTPVDTAVCDLGAEACDFGACETIVAFDQFSRVVTGGWGTANLGGTWIEVDVMAGFRYSTTVIYTINGSFTKASFPGIQAVFVRLVGGGGGSGGVGATAAGQCACAGGGGGGGYAERFILASALGASETVTIGVGGAGGAAGANNGVDGGTTSFGAIMQGFGGNKGFGVASSGVTNSSNGGDGGAGNNGDVNVQGGAGTNGSWVAGGSPTGWGYGGASQFAGTQRTTVNSANAGRPGIGFGGGASGALNYPSQVAQAGAAGSNGIVIVDVYV